MNQLRQIMTQSVASVSPQDNVYKAASLMKQHNIGAVPVVENGQIRGMVTDRDLVLRALADQQNEAVSVGEVMSNQVVSGSPDMTVGEASQLMAQNQIRRLPVVENNQLVGMVSLGDLAVRNTLSNEAGQALSNISKPSSPQM
ncbi:MAG: CBS domain-containing protein [Firmicutes bacterium]|uniref:CBS domain-containing protein n=1 Tax=Melghirimyces thermohalophilus TaxID=1236220 RepID=A0A1G6QIC8_9BACL|nr:CBS domain-containing protein [Melghirimyces thermohalophilus]MDA8352057.1 CBS domain-containing protein [Bacillota bacterium]SDC91405.1 CBS domain-containing protein [Melghirimyces thermohalophilus]